MMRTENFIMRKIFTNFLIMTFSFLLLGSCAGELELSGVKRPISKKGGLGYSAAPDPGSPTSRPFLTSIDSFLNWYSDEELETVTVLNITNRDAGTGEIQPLYTTKGIERLPNLRKLIISSSGIEVVEGVKRLRQLEWIELFENEVTELRGISKLENLIFISLVGNPIESIQDIDGNNSVWSIALDRAELTNLDGIERFPNLKSVSVIDNQLRDVTALKSLSKLEGLAISSDDNDYNEESVQFLEQLEQEKPDMFLAY